MASVHEVDELAISLFARSNLSPDAEAFRVAWEAYGVWSNGGFEAVLTGGLADDGPAIVGALRSVEAIQEATLFEQAFVLVEGDIDARNDIWANSEVWQAAADLDTKLAELDARRPFKEAVLGALLDHRPDLRQGGG